MTELTETELLRAALEDIQRHVNRAAGLPSERNYKLACEMSGIIATRALDGSYKPKVSV